MFGFNCVFGIDRRAKEKRLKKDAGRTRWSQYFRSMKGGSSPRLDKLLDKDELKVDLDSFSHGECQLFTNILDLECVCVIHLKISHVFHGCFVLFLL